MATSASRDKGLGSKRIRILIVDDHAVLQAGLRMLLDAEPDMEVVGGASNGAQALQAVRELAPDVALLDISMPGMDGLQILRLIRDAGHSTRAVILTMHDDEGYLREALAAGACGFVLKRAADTDLLAAIRAVHAGGTFLHSEHARLLLDGMLDRHRGQSAQGRDLLLSPREREVLRLIALGHTNQQAAAILFLSVKTVEAYRARLMTKLGLKSRAELVLYALKHGLIGQ